MSRKNKKHLALLAYGGAFAIWGLNTPFIKIGLESFPVLSLLAIKYIFGAVVFTFLARKHWKRLPRGMSYKIVIATLSGYVLTSALYYYGIQYAGGLNASLVYLVAPLLLYFLSIEILKEKYNSKILVGVVASLLGAILIVGAPILNNVSNSSEIFFGCMLIFFAVIADVSSTVIIKPILTKTSAMQMTAVRFIIAAIVFTPFLFIESAQLIAITFTPALVVAIGYNLLFATLFAFFLYHWGLRKLSGEQASPLYYIDPMVGAVASMILLGEQLSTYAIAGIGLILVGLYLSEAHIKLPSRHFSHHR